MLQGTEEPDARQRVWGFVQPAMTFDRGDELSGLAGFGAVNNGKYIAQNLIAPEFEDQTSGHFRRFRIGFRGRFTGHLLNPVTEQMNFFILTEMAPNLITYRPFGDRARKVGLTDLSVTFNHMPGARIRLGQFKTPGPDETMQGIHAFDYIEFTDFARREILERFVAGNLEPAPPGGAVTAFTTTGIPVTEAYGFSAARDRGIQVFDSFRQDKWDLSYALMLGNGEAINRWDRDNNKDIYLYLSGEYGLPGGKGAYKNGVKLSGWYQHGEREFVSDPDAREFERTRYGLGFRALGKIFGGQYRHRLAADILFADGMLFFNPLGGVAGNFLRYAAESGNKSRALTLDYGFYLNQYLQFDFRYHWHNLLYEQAGPWHPQDERIFKSFTLGMNLHVRKNIRFTINYIKEDADAPNPSTIYSPVANSVVTNNMRQTVKTLGDRVALQLTWIF